MLKVVILLIKCLMIVLGLVLAVLALYFYNGSLEEFPTIEDHEKVRVVSGFLIGVGVLAELILFSVLRLLGGKSKKFSLK